MSRTRSLLRAFTQRTDDLDKAFPEEQIEELAAHRADEVTEALQELTQRPVGNGVGIAERWSDVKELIAHVKGRIEYWEDRRTQFMQLAIGLLGGSVVAAVAALPKLMDASGIILYGPLLCWSIVLLFGGTAMLWLWNRQNNPSYPFTKAQRTWRWHYRHAEKSPLDCETHQYTQQSFREEAKRFADNTVEYKLKTYRSDVAELLDQDLTQLFLLLTNEKFKIRFVSCLRDCFVKTLWLSVCFAVLAAVVIGSISVVSNLGDSQPDAASEKKEPEPGTEPTQKRTQKLSRLHRELPRQTDHGLGCPDDNLDRGLV